MCSSLNPSPGRLPAGVGRRFGNSDQVLWQVRSLGSQEKSCGAEEWLPAQIIDADAEGRLCDLGFPERDLNV